MTDTAKADITPREEELLLEEIRDRFNYADSEWAKIRDEGRTDMRYAAGQHWDQKDLDAREKAGRPALAFDELGQYINQTINDIRRNKRGIKVAPQGGGATDETAEFRQNLIRQIEHRSNAPTVAYTTMYENAVQRSYGFLRVNARYSSPRSRHQELLIDAIPNPDTVTADPDFLDPTGKDWKYLFLRESRSVKDFTKEFPNARVQSFDSAALSSVSHASQWANAERLWIAEYWKVDSRREHLLYLSGPVITRDGRQRQDVYASEIEDGALSRFGVTVEGERWTDVPYVCQYLTNGVELLAKEGAPKKTEWPGQSIPFVMCPGKILYVTEGGVTERKIESLIRKARDPQMFFDYVGTAEAELVKITPKTPFVGYEGQFRGHEDDWAEASEVPKAFLQARPTTEQTGQQILPLPIRQPYDPPIASLEIAKESARRSIQAAMGISPLPTAAQRRSEKSGVALEVMRDAEQQGAYHFVDHYELAIMRAGAILDELIPHYYDAARDVTIRKQDDAPEVVRINDPSAEKGYDATAGEHDVTISVGPAFASQREAAETFADSLAQNPQVFPLVGDLVVKLKQLGPIGDEISDRLKALLPPELREAASEGQPPTPGDVAALKAQMQQMGQALQEAQQAIATEQAKQQAIVEKAQIEADRDLRLAEMENQLKLTIAEIEARQKSFAAEQQAGAKVLEISAKAEEAEKQRQHEAAMSAANAAQSEHEQGREHEHAAGMADRQAAHKAAEAKGKSDASR